jgi:hypothetical protein
VLEFDHMVEEAVAAAVRAGDHGQVAVAAADGGLGVHDVAEVVEQHGQERGLDHQLVGPAQIAVVEHRQVAPR